MEQKAKLLKFIQENNLRTLDDFDEMYRQMTKLGIETLLAEEMKTHLGYAKHDYQSKQSSNSRNGYSDKRVTSNVGEIPLEIPRDREGTFLPQVVKKGQRDISGLEEKVISMYAKGMSFRDIQAHLLEIYGYECSPEYLSTLTDRVMERVTEWQNRPLERLYPILFLDALFYKVRSEGKVKNLAVYCLLGISIAGKKECLGVWMAESESSRYWLTVLNEIKNRGVEDILIACVDGLTGFEDAIRAVYPQVEVQQCIVHQIRTSLRYVSWKDQKALLVDLKKIYTAPTEEMALMELERFAKIWDARYPQVSKSWRTHWSRLATFFKYPPEIRQLIYTTNPIESFHRGLKKITKTKAVFPHEAALTKLLFLVIQDLSKKWTKTLSNWYKIFPQLLIYFEERLAPYV
jgi:putative transposase